MDRLTAQSQAFSSFSTAAYDDRCTIQRPTSAKGSTGGNVPGAPQVLATNVPCRLSASSASEREFAGAPQGATAYTVRLPQFKGSMPLEIDSRCELVVAARGSIASQTLKVTAPLLDMDGKIDVVAVKHT